MDRVEKKEFVTTLRSGVESAELVVLTSPSGLTVAEVSDLRRQMREAGATFKVVKNTLARIALEGTKFTSLMDKLKGPIALAYSTDPVAAAKVAMNFAKDNKKLSVLSGVLGDKSLSAAEVDALAKLPSLDEMRAKVLAVISAPAQQLVGVINAPGSQLARVISAHSRNG